MLVSIGGLSVILLELKYVKDESDLPGFNRRVVGYTTGALLLVTTAPVAWCFNRRVVGYTTGAQITLHLFHQQYSFNRRVVGYTTGAYFLLFILEPGQVSIGGLSVILLELTALTFMYGQRSGFNRRVVGYTTGALLMEDYYL